MLLTIRAFCKRNVMFFVAVVISIFVGLTIPYAVREAPKMQWTPMPLE